MNWTGWYWKEVKRLSGLDFEVWFNEINLGIFRRHTILKYVKPFASWYQYIYFKQIRYIINNYSLPPHSHDLTGSWCFIVNANMGCKENRTKAFRSFHLRCSKRPPELCRVSRVCCTMSFHWSSEISRAQAGIPREGKFTAAMVLLTSSTWSVKGVKTNIIKHWSVQLGLFQLSLSECTLPGSIGIDAWLCCAAAASRSSSSSLSGAGGWGRNKPMACVNRTVGTDQDSYHTRVKHSTTLYSVCYFHFNLSTQ